MYFGEMPVRGNVRVLFIYLNLVYSWYIKVAEAINSNKKYIYILNYTNNKLTIVVKLIY